MVRKQRTHYGTDGMKLGKRGYDFEYHEYPENAVIQRIGEVKGPLTRSLVFVRQTECLALASVYCEK